MIYGFDTSRYYSVRVRTGDMSASQFAITETLIKWALAHKSEGRFHYKTDYNDTDYMIWSFELEQDAILFKLKFV